MRLQRTRIVYNYMYTKLASFPDSVLPLNLVVNWKGHHWQFLPCEMTPDDGLCSMHVGSAEPQRHPSNRSFIIVGFTNPSYNIHHSIRCYGVSSRALPFGL